jgi:hypothetical protein
VAEWLERLSVAEVDGRFRKKKCLPNFEARWLEWQWLEQPVSKKARLPNVVAEWLEWLATDFEKKTRLHKFVPRPGRASLLLSNAE